MVHYAAGRYDAAIELLYNEATYRSGSRKALAAALAMTGRDREARREAEIFLANNPRFSLARWAASQPCPGPAVVTRFVEGMRKAGFPD